MTNEERLMKIDPEQGKDLGEIIDYYIEGFPLHPRVPFGDWMMLSCYGANGLEQTIKALKAMYYKGYCDGWERKVIDHAR